MAAPVDAASAVSSNGSSVTAHVVTLPASIAAGDIIIAQVMMDGASGGFSWPNPWVGVIDATIGASVASIGVGWLRASGGETSVTVTSVNAERSTHIAKRITGGHATSNPEFSATATGSSTTPNPDSLTASWGAEENLWGAYYGVDSGEPSAYPLTGGQISSGTTPTSAAYGGACSQALTQATLDPGTFTNTISDDWRAGTWVVRPAAAGGSAALAGLVAGQSTLAGDLTDNPAALLAGVIGGQSTLAGDLTPGATSAALAGVIGGISTLSADLTPAPAAQLAGIIAAQSGLQGTLFDPADVVLPTLSAIGNCFIELWAPTPPLAKWGSALWGTGLWSSEGWQDITPQSQNVRFGWGANDASQGILTQVAANAWTVYTYDPDRLLDPANDQSPYFDSLRPGANVQVRYDDGTNARIVKEGTIDSIAYSLQEQRGQIRVVDRVGQMAGAKLPAGLTGVPTTLYAATRFLLTAAGLDKVIWVGADPAPFDPIIGVAITDETSVWDWLNTIALDCMHGVYVVANDINSPVNGRTGIRSVVKFVNFTATPIDNGLIIGGGLGIPIEDIQPHATREGVFSQVTTFDDGAPTTPITVTDLDAVNRFGVVPYKRDRPAPSGTGLADTILADRAGASLQYDLGTLRPVTTAQLLALFDAQMLESVHIVGDSRDNGDDPIENPIDIDAQILGVSFEANTSTGWSATAQAYITKIWWG